MHIVRDRLGFLTEDDLPMDAAGIRRSIAEHIEYTLAKDARTFTPRDLFFAVARAARDRMADRWNRTERRDADTSARRVYYLSMEYLPGRLLRDGLVNLGIYEPTRSLLAEMGIDIDEVCSIEPDLGLGNGGLGRLASCFLDSMATLGLPAVGYGIRYEYGIFRQTIVDGAQMEQPDNWLRHPNPWEVARSEHVHAIKLEGRVATRMDGHGRMLFDLVDTHDVLALAHDIPIPGYRNNVVNTLRLWQAKATREFDIGDFNRGDYIEAVRTKNSSEDISRVLYPNDNILQGKALRLKQEYFFVSASIQDVIARHLGAHPSVRTLHEKAIFQLNDTHPAIAVAELMRLLMDVHRLEWDDAWGVTTKCLAYTNHTLMPEALERWPVWLLERVLPRHLQIIFEIDRRHTATVRSLRPDDEQIVERVGIVERGADPHVRMANLAIVGSSKVNGVSALHSRLLRERMFPEHSALYPDRFCNQTNGVTPRRWLLQSNPALSALITEAIGDAWPTKLDELKRLERFATDESFQWKWRAAKEANKSLLLPILERDLAIRVDPTTLFDVQIKRMHEYKRQLLNVLHVITRYLEIKRDGGPKRAGRTVILAGKAAPGYEMAKRVIQLIHGVADVVNRDRDVAPFLKLLFVPNYGVSLAERLIPAADLSEQISTAGFEASGTGNMKFGLNGALTIGTLDGANIEIEEAVGAENIFVFGLTAEEVVARRATYRPRQVMEQDPQLLGAIDSLLDGTFSNGDRDRYRPIVDALLGDDHFMVLADYRAYVEAQRKVDTLFANTAAWTEKSIINVARMGRFSSDATISGYAREIWNISPPSS